MNLISLKPYNIKVVDDLNGSKIERIPYTVCRKPTSDDMLNDSIKELLYRHLMTECEPEVAERYISMMFSEESVDGALNTMVEGIRGALVIIATLNEFNQTCSFGLDPVTEDDPLYELKNAYLDDIEISEISPHENNVMRTFVKISYVKRNGNGEVIGVPIRVSVEIPLKNIRDDRRDVLIAEKGDFLYYIETSAVGKYGDGDPNKFVRYVEALKGMKTSFPFFEIAIRNEKTRHCSDCVRNNSKEDKCFGVCFDTECVDNAIKYLVENNNLRMYSGDLVKVSEEETIHVPNMDFTLSINDIKPLFGKKFAFTTNARIMVETSLAIKDFINFNK